MFRLHNNCCRAAHRNRAGLTMIEMLIAVSIMGIMAASLGALALAVQTSNEYSQGHGTAVQHARVALERIERAIHGAPATADFPGCAVFSQQVGSWTFPETLVVWRPAGAPANPDGPPLFSELVIFCPDPDEPNRLLEITVPSDNRPVPSLSDGVAWASELAAIKGSNTSEKVLLTDMMRTASATDMSVSTPTLRGAVRFELEIRPSPSEWSNLKGGILAWDDLSWVQDIHGSQTGLRQAWCRIELQMMPDSKGASKDPTGQQTIGFFGSAALYYELRKPS